MASRWTNPAAVALLAGAALAGCRCTTAPVAGAPRPAEAAEVPAADARCAGLDAADPARDDPGRALEAFDRAFDEARWDEALACARRAARLAPDEPAAHLDRALALDALGRTDLALQAYDRALALAPDDPPTLRTVADFLVRLGSDDALETAIVHARRGRELSGEAAEGAELAALEAQALNLLGRCSEALRVAESGLALDSEEPGAALERAVALVELLRFDEARPALARARELDPGSARARWYAALVAERDGREAEARREFAEATRLDPQAFPEPPAVDEQAFAALVAAEVARLTDAQRAELARCRVATEEVPALADLQAGDPVLSPTIVGLYLPGEDGEPDRVVLYRRNLLRLVASPEELAREVRNTLLHELGHRAGEDDQELRDRGL